MAQHVFISHSTKNKNYADAISDALESKGIPCWYAPRDVLPGMDWGASIVEAIASASVLVLVLSSDANQSPQITREVERAADRRLPIITVRVEDVSPSMSLEYFISKMQWLDAFTPPLKQHLLRLVNSVSRILDKQTTTTMVFPSVNASTGDMQDAEQDPFRDLDDPSSDITKVTARPSGPIMHLLVSEPGGVTSRVVVPSWGGMYTIGRHPSNKLILTDQESSRRHAFILYVDDAFNIVDGVMREDRTTIDRSANGLEVNGTPRYQCRLGEGDVITIGQTKIEVMYFE